jgi:hypothetical protein
LVPSNRLLQRKENRKSANFRISDEGTLCKYLGIKVTRQNDNSFLLTQPQLIQSILDDLHLPNTAKESQVPYLSSKLLTPNLQDTDFNGHFDYCSVIGNLNYLEKSTRPELAYAVHQCARFCSAPKCSHGEAVKRIGRYLLGTKDKGLILEPTKESFDCWVDASHAGKWN